MRRVAAFAAGLLAAAFTLVIPAVPATATAPRLAPAGTNLLINPDAETGNCTTSGFDAMTIPGWAVTKGSPDSVCYGSIGFPRHSTAVITHPSPAPPPSSAPSSPELPGAPAPLTGAVPAPRIYLGPPDEGRAFFSGGATGDSIMSQTVKLGAAALPIDAYEVSYTVGGWLGGYAAQNDRAAITTIFTDSAGRVVRTPVELPAVTNTERSQTTSFVHREITGLVPPEARAVTIIVTFAWSAGDTTDGYADNLSFTITAPATPPRLTVPKNDVPAFDHVFFVFMENENYAKGEAPAGHGDYISGNPKAAYLNSNLAYNGSQLAQMYATTHPSDPNYLAVTGGDTFGWVNNPVVGSNRINAPHIGDRLDGVGKTWRGYADGAAGPCDTTSHNTAAGGHYLPDDEPFMLYADVVGNQARCEAHNQPLTQLSTDLESASTTPSFVWFAANDVDSMENGGVAAGDAWLARTLPMIFALPAWTKQRSLLIVSWDEAHRKAFGPDYSNHVATYVTASQGLVKDDYVSPIRYTGYSLAATIEDALGIAPLTSNDKYARPLEDIWTTTSSGGGGSAGGVT